jgi:hypothetical protein
MGFLDRIKRALSGEPTPPDESGETGKLPREYRSFPRAKLAQVAKRHLTVRQPDPLLSAGKPYAFARRSSRTGTFSDRRVGGKPERLRRFGMPEFATPEELAAWLKLPLKTIAWLADFHSRNAQEEVLKKQHYRYTWRAKRRKGGWRLIESPKPLLKLVQQRILREILDRVPVHAAAHGFVKGRSILSNAAPHAGKYVVVRCDLADFYPSIPAGRIRGIFSGLGYNSEIAWWLAQLCTNRVPHSLEGPGSLPVRRAFAGSGHRHLPQGAPTSPALANLAAWALDVRLSGLARKFSVAYTRYADDLTFSGDEKCLRGPTMAYLLAYVRGIIRNERFVFQPAKRKLIRQGGRQVVTGLTVNQKPNVPRPYFDKLKAILHNCAKHGPSLHNREDRPDFRAHLEGQIAFVRSVNPQKAERLQRSFDRIFW